MSLLDELRRRGLTRHPITCETCGEIAVCPKCGKIVQYDMERYGEVKRAVAEAEQQDAARAKMERAK